jgi:uncharacterized membrane protein YgcG
MRHSLLAATLLASTATLGHAGAASAADDARAGVPRVYLVPMTGQMGTDINRQFCEMIAKDVKAVKPDIVVYKLNSADKDRIEHLSNDDPTERGIPSVEEFRDMVKFLHEELRDTRQIMWVVDAVGISSVIAFGWPDMYMASDARIEGAADLGERVKSQWEDADVRMKMLAAWQGMIKATFQQGGYPISLADALIYPEEKLSVRFKGREVEWLNDASGTWVIDGSDKAPAVFSGTLAVDTLLCDGIADSLDDLLYLLDAREYDELENGVKLQEQYVEDWRKAFRRCQDWMKDAGEVEESVAGLGKRKALFQKVLAALRQYDAVKTRMQQMGVSEAALLVQIDNIEKDIQRARDAEKNGGGFGGGGGGGRGLGGGGGFGGRRGG